MQRRWRDTIKRTTLGDVATLTFQEARRRARELLVKSKLDGLPVRSTAPTCVAVTFRDFVDEFWRDYSPHWKPATQSRSRGAIDRVLVPFFGSKKLPAIDRQDVLAFRETRSHRAGSFHTDLAVLSAMLGYAEKLKYRAKGSNPCRGVPRYKRPLKERFLSTQEYRRLATVLREREGRMVRSVSVIRLLIFTGARTGEIDTLCWEWLTPTFARLPDSKSGPKRLYLNSAANAVLDGLGRKDAGPVFCAASRTKLSVDWGRLRRWAAIPDVRLHDLRHSFASVAITSGIPLLTIGRLLGHALPETTERYAHLADNSIHDAARRVSGSIAQSLGLRP